MEGVIDFSSNDYLGLSDSVLVREWLHESVARHGFGSTGSRLLSGNKAVFESLERKIAIAKETDAALVFNSGYQANVMVLSALLDPRELSSQALVFFDRCNHSSLYQGAMLSRAALVPYNHLDFDDLERKLKRFIDDPRPKCIVSETFFGMDGDILDVVRLSKISFQYNTFLYLDDAHATGVLGKSNHGLAYGADLVDIPHLIMGTFSKAMGAFGAYVASSRTIIDYIINRCPGFIYTTAMPPAFIEVIERIWDILPLFAVAVRNMLHKADNLRSSLIKLGTNPGGMIGSNIITINVRTDERALLLNQKLSRKGLLLSAIRPPTVPRGHSRLKISLNIKHSLEDLDALLRGLSNVFEDYYA